MYTQMPWPIAVAVTLWPILITFLVSIEKHKYEPPSRFFSKQTWNCYDIIWILLLFLLIGCINWLLVCKELVSLSQRNTYGRLLLLVLPAILLYAILRFKYGLGISTLGFTFENSVPRVILGLRISFVFGFVWFFGALLIGEDQFLVDMSRWLYNIRVLEMAWDQLFVFFFAAVVAAPIVEESVFRGVMYSPFSRKIGHKGAMFVTSLVWAIWHSHTKSIAALITMGMIFAYFYVKTRSLIPGIIAHSMTNLIWLITLIYSWLFQSHVLSIDTHKFIVFMALFFFLGFIILSIISRRLSAKPKASGGWITRWVHGVKR